MSEEPQSFPPVASERQAQLESLIAGYIRETEAGRTPQRQELLKQYPEFAAELTQFFGQRDRLNRLVDPIREFGDDLYQSIGPGKQLSYVGNYELLEEIARGGMGVVYKAQQTTLGRIVAVKMIVAGRLANEQDVQRFKSEAQAAASLKHPHIVPIHEVGQHEGWHYFSMDYIEGHDLATVLRQNLLPAKTAATYVRQMAQAIHYAHQQGILHRDLKPSNILIDGQHQVHITDFGLATRVEEDQGLTLTGQILGTPSYMPPEQAQGKRGLIGPASDVYSLGAILYECLTGRPPFRAESVIKTIEQVIHAEAASPRTLNAAIPRDLETICLKCLQKEPHKRYGTAEQLSEDLRCFLAGEPIAARPVGSAERAWRWCRRNPAVAGLMATVAASLTVGTTVSSYFAVEAGQRAKAEAVERQRAELARKSEMKLEMQAKRDVLHRLSDSYLAQARAVRLSQQPGQRFDSLNAVAAARKLVTELGQGQDEILALRNEAIASLMLPDIRLAAQWPGHGAATEKIQIAVDKNLERYAQLEAENAILVRGMSDNRELARLPPELSLGSLHDNCPYLRFSPDGKLLAVKGRAEFGRDGKLLAFEGRKTSTGAGFFIWDLETNSLVGQGPAGGIYNNPRSTWSVEVLDFSPDSRTLAINDNKSISNIVFYRPDDHGIWQPQGTLPPDSNNSPALHCIRFHPQRSELVECRGTTVLVRNFETGETIKRLGLNDSAVSSGAKCRTAFWSDCGRFLAYSLGDRVYLWDSEMDTEPTVYEGHTADVEHVSINPSGNLLISTGRDHSTRLWDPRSGRQWLRTEHYGTHFSRDGRWLGLGLAGVAIGRWEVTDGSEFRMLGRRLPKSIVADLDFSPDGKMLVAGSLSQGLRVFDLSTSEPIPNRSPILTTETIDGQFDIAFGCSFDPDGRGLLTSSYTHGVRHFPIEFDKQQQPLRIGDPRTLPHVSLGRHARRQDGAIVAGCTSRHSLQIFDPTSPGRQISSFGTRSPDCFVAFSSDGHWVATGPWNGSAVTVWDAGTGQSVRTLTGDFQTAARVDFDPLQRWLVVTTPLEQILYESSGSPTQWAVARRIPMTQPHRGVATFSPDGRLLAFSDTPSSVKLLDTTTFTEVAQLSAPDSDLIHSLRFSRDGHLLAAGTDNGQVMLWDLQRIRSQLAVMDLDWSDAQGLPEVPHTNSFRTWPDSGLRSSHWERTWQVAQGRFTATFSFDGTQIAAPDEKLVKVWSVADGEELLSLETSSGLLFDVAFSPDGRWVAGAGVDGVIIWDAASGKEIARPKRDKGFRGHRVMFSPDSAYLLVGRTGGATLWRTESWDLHFDMPDKRGWLSGVSFSSDGEAFAVCGLQKGIAVHQINGDLLRTFEGYGAKHHTLAVNPTGETLAVTGPRALAVWDLVSGEERYVIHEQNENVVTFSSDGLLLATALDRPHPVMIIRDAANGREQIRLSGHASVNSAVFSPDSQRLVSADGAGAIMLWQLPPHKRQTVPSPP